jgi:hypothetical protein
VVLGTLLLALFLVTPVIHVGILTDRPRLLALYPGLVAMAMIAASLGMMFVIQLARLIGHAYTSLFAQVLGTVVIVWLCYMPQVQQAIPVAIKTSLSLLLDDGAVLTGQPALAAGAGAAGQSASAAAAVLSGGVGLCTTGRCAAAAQLPAPVAAGAQFAARHSASRVGDALTFRSACGGC